ncbi:MAG TPA: ATP synthase F1 subunit delta [Salinivirgaceae bacterium]|nr:ATP synthase F1 subunit delta [Salinivirgaceae bacterium]
MNQSSIPIRYAKALYDLALKEGKTQEVFHDLESIQNMIKSDSNFNRFFLSPIISKTEKKSILQNVLVERTQILTQRFIQYLIEKRREEFFSRIVLAYKKSFYEEKGFVEVTVVSAIELSESQKEQIASIIRDQVRKEPKIEFNLDPTLIGGFKLIVGDSILDQSIKYKLEILQKAFTK